VLNRPKAEGILSRNALHRRDPTAEYNTGIVKYNRGRRVTLIETIKGHKRIPLTAVKRADLPEDKT
jgi:hypothetical protein